MKKFVLTFGIFGLLNVQNFCLADTPASPLFDAVSQCDLVKVQKLIAAGVAINALDDDHRNALYSLERSDDCIPLVAILASAKINLENHDNYGDTPLTSFIEYQFADMGHGSAIEAILIAGANPNNPTSDGRSPLLVASGDNSTSFSDSVTAKLLLEKGANPKSLDPKNGRNALFFASDYFPVQEFITAGGDINLKDRDGFTPLMAAASKQGADLLLPMFIQAGANAKAKSDAGYTSLMFAASLASLEPLKILVNAKADVNAAANDGTTALMVAGKYKAMGDQLSCVRFLISSGADKTLKTSNGGTALSIARSQNVPQYILDLLEIGSLKLANVCSRSDYIKSSIESATAKTCDKITVGDLIAVRLLYSKGDLIQLLPGDLNDLIGLTEVTLTSAGFTDFPAGVTNLTSIVSLDLSGNYFSVIPDEIKNLENLLHFDVSHNQKLSNLPENISKLTNLMQLAVGHTGVKIIPESYTQLHALKYLGVEGDSGVSIPQFPSNVFIGR